MKVVNDESAPMERAMPLFIKLCRHPDKKEEACHLAQTFHEKFPDSKYGEKIKKAIVTKPGELFPQKADPSQGQVKTEYPEEGGDGPQIVVLCAIGFGAEVISDPRFMIIWLAATIIFDVGLIVRGATEDRIWQMKVYVFIFVFAVTAVFRTDWIACFIHVSRRSEETARKEVDTAMNYEQATFAERGDNYSKAVELYEKVLKNEPDNIQARFNLARIYHHRLQDKSNALRHYRKLIDILPPQHP